MTKKIAWVSATPTDDRRQWWGEVEDEDGNTLHTTELCPSEAEAFQLADEWCQENGYTPQTA